MATVLGAELFVGTCDFRIGHPVLVFLYVRVSHVLQSNVPTVLKDLLAVTIVLGQAFWEWLTTLRFVPLKFPKIPPKHVQVGSQTFCRNGGVREIGVTHRFCCAKPFRHAVYELAKSLSSRRLRKQPSGIFFRWHRAWS